MTINAGLANKTEAAVDQGLRAYMLGVYNRMFAGIALSGLAAAVMANVVTSGAPDGSKLNEFGEALLKGPLAIVIALAPLAIVLLMSFKAEKMSAPVVAGLFYGLCLLMGVSLTSVVLTYTAGSMAKVFFITAATFGALSLYGYTTRTNLSAIGSFLVMGLFGLIIASIVNIFMASSALDFVISIAGVLIFAGLTAWDTQKIKEMYDAGGDREKLMTFGALSLYLDFINLFLFFLRLFGSKDD
jgi:FtsH-binding integral membrane protein